jgi:hypothetical protein
MLFHYWVNAMIQEAVLSGAYCVSKVPQNTRSDTKINYAPAPVVTDLRKWNAGYMWSIPTQSL